MKIAVLSNVNADYIVKQLQMKYEVSPTEGYGLVWEPLLNADSSLHEFSPFATIIMVDLMAMIQGDVEIVKARKVIDAWFSMLDQCIDNSMEYLVPDAVLAFPLIENIDEFSTEGICSYWNDCLQDRLNHTSNLHRLPLARLVQQYGVTHLYDRKLWYMGKIPYSYNGNNLIVQMISRTLQNLYRVPKKVLLLDLDNTLWGGIVGEEGVEGILLSDDNIGAIYRDVQLKIQKMKQRGVLLAIVSKNNFSDVEKVWQKQPYMLLRRDDFVSVHINWRDKAENIKEIAEELNLGLDSFVFVDDMASERENIRMQLPAVSVPEFPNHIEKLPAFWDEVFRDYFQRGKLTDEDLEKTKQYQDNVKREESRQGVDFDTFLKNLHIRVRQVPLDERVKERVAQLIHKTNQFNLTTRRYTRRNLEEMLTRGWDIYAYRVSDRFGDYGIVAVIIVAPEESRIDSFIMSCRIMGKRIENYFLDKIEQDMLERGKTVLYGEYIPTEKNVPVKEFFVQAGYTPRRSNEQGTIYGIELAQRPKRIYSVEEI